MIGAKALVSNVKLRVSVAVVDAHANISYVMPVAGIKYIELKVKASLDTVNRNPYIVDSTVVFDTVALEAAKKFYESIGSTDVIKNYVFDKGLKDSVSALDTVNVLLIFIRNFADSANITESKAIAYFKAFSSDFSLTDNDTYSSSKKISDGVAMQDGADATDGNVTSISKYVMNMAFPTDIWVKAVQKALSDTQSTTDSLAYLVNRVDNDLVYTEDTKTFSTALGKTDTVLLTESRFSDFSKGTVLDSIAFSDQIVKNPNKGLSDSAAPEDTGRLYAQNYCDITYFLEDYVGEYRTFT